MTIAVQLNSTKKLLEKATQSYTEQLFANESALTYLVKRGLTRETVESFRLGLVKEPYPDSGHDFQVDRLSIPYITQTGIVQVRFRAIPYTGIPGDPEPSPKMKSEVGAGSTIYNARALMQSEGYLAVCEGEFDTMSAVQAGINAIGIPGATNWQNVYSRVLMYRKVIVLADNDDHGEGMKFAEKVQNGNRGIRIVLMPKGEDVNSYLVKFGEDELRKLAKVDV